MTGIETQIVIINASVSFYHREMRRARTNRKMWEIHLRLGQLNRDLDKLLSK